MGLPEGCSQDQPGLQASQNWISRCPLSSTLMRLLVGFTCSQNIVQRILSVPWHMASWLGSCFLSIWAIKNARERQQEESQIFFYSILSRDFPTFLPHSHCWKWVSMYISPSVAVRYTKQWKPGVGISESISDTAHHTGPILYKDYVLQAIQDSGPVHLLFSIFPN